MLRLARAAAAVVAGCLAAAASAAAPPSTPLTFAGGYAPAERVAGTTLDALDLARVAAEDAEREAAGRPHRFAVPHETAIDAHRAGTWERAGDHSVWRYRVRAKGATSLNFGFTRYRLPPSARLYLYDAARRQVAGPYDARKNEPHGQLWTPIIAADDVLVELDVASAEKDQVTLLLGRINQGYRGLGGASRDYRQPDAGQPKLGKTCSPDQVNSGSCNMDVACLADDDPWNKPRRAVGAITLGGSDDCTGSLVNNTANDRRMLFVTATHCGLTASSSPTAVVYWNYEWPTCRTPGSAASGQSNPPDPTMSSSGATFIANTPSPFDSSCNAGNNTHCSDHTLVELDDPPNPAFDLYWEGWDRRGAGATCSQSATDPHATAGLCASIHHPNVDEKRITFVARDLLVGGISAGVNSHWHAYWDPTPPILANIPAPQPTALPPGVTEPGSSGSPLYTAQQRLVGVLSGGPSSCGATGEDLSDYYGQLALAWDGLGTPATRMKDHLDPLGLAPEFIDGIGQAPFTLSLDPPSLAVCADAGSATVAVGVAGDPGFADPVTLSASGEPPGSTTAFAPPGVTPPGSSTLTIGALGAATPGRYTLTVTGSSGGDEVPAALPFSLNDVTPAAVTPVAPADQAVGVAAAPTLTWSAAGSGGPTDYRVEVARDQDFAAAVFSQTVHDATSVAVAPALDPFTTYYWRVTAANACGSAAASPVFRFRTASAPGTCDPGTEARTLFSDDVENGAGGWSTAGSTGASTWTISTTRANSPTHAWYAKDVTSVSDQRLTSPTIALPANESPLTLSFATWRQIESSSGGCYDGGLLEVSTDGTTFAQVPDGAIISGGGYTGPVSASYDNPLANLPAWCGARAFTAGPVRVDLSAYAGQNVQLRFRLGTDSSTGQEGWYVDDVAVSSCASTAGDDTIFADGFDGAPAR